MNNEIETIQKKKKFKLRFSYVLGDEPYMDWLIILILGTIIAISGIVSGFFIYKNLDSVMKKLPDLQSKQASQFSNIYDKNKLELLKELIEDRSRDFGKGYEKKTLDPSL
jgi:hypothetical protein